MPQSRPNILLFFPDQLRADWVGRNNPGGAHTPHVDALMARGVSFSNAICPSPLCGPSRACLATGREYDRNPVPDNKHSMDPDGPNLYRQLENAGYQVLASGKADLLKGEHDWGADGQHADADGGTRQRRLGFTGGLDSAGKHAVLEAAAKGKDEPYLAFLRGLGLEQAHLADMADRKGAGTGAGRNYTNTAPSPLPDEAYQDVWVADCGLKALQAAAPGQPWFLQVNFVGPHEPMNITAAMAASVAARMPPLPDNPGDLPAETHLAIRRNYTAMIEKLDTQLGRFVDALKASGQLENTVVILASDHGEMLGDAGRWKKSLPQQASIAVPLVFAGPGIARGQDTAQPATILDLCATILEMAEAAPLAGGDSRSLVSTLENPALAAREVVFCGLADWRLAFDGTFKLVAGFEPGQAARGKGEFVAFDPRTWRLVRSQDGPEEAGDLSPQHPEAAARLRQALISHLRAGGLAF